MSRFRGLLLYCSIALCWSGGILFHAECCIRQFFSPYIISHNKTIITHKQINALINIYPPPSNIHTYLLYFILMQWLVHVFQTQHVEYGKTAKGAYVSHPVKYARITVLAALMVIVRL